MPNHTKKNTKFDQELYKAFRWKVGVVELKQNFFTKFQLILINKRKRNLTLLFYNILDAIVSFFLVFCVYMCLYVLYVSVCDACRCIKVRAICVCFVVSVVVWISDVTRCKDEDVVMFCNELRLKREVLESLVWFTSEYVVWSGAWCFDQ